jgi:CrcB protein
VVSGQWSVVSGQWSVVSGQWSVVEFVLAGRRVKAFLFVAGVFLKGPVVVYFGFILKSGGLRMETFKQYAVVAGFGALGAMTRLFLNGSVMGKLWSPFPVATFFINVSGSFLMGFLIALAAEKTAFPPLLRLALTTGFLGAYTTFSTFEYETLVLSREHGLAWAGGYVAVSVLAGFLGVAAGDGLARAVFSSSGS